MLRQLKQLQIFPVNPKGTDRISFLSFSKFFCPFIHFETQASCHQTQLHQVDVIIRYNGILNSYFKLRLHIWMKNLDALSFNSQSSFMKDIKIILIFQPKPLHLFFIFLLAKLRVIGPQQIKDLTKHISWTVGESFTFTWKFPQVVA